MADILLQLNGAEKDDKSELSRFVEIELDKSGLMTPVDESFEASTPIEKQFNANNSFMRMTGNLNDTKVSISRTSAFVGAYGNVMRNAVAFVLEENEDDNEALLVKLETIDKNLDMEMENINMMIATMNPRQSTRYAKLANDLKNNLT